ncbi:hypothetical protein MLD38_013911 [Melastoma candidum]|uniref:Uncharacterized protein n=1 Tax=Melastoma candidum TaxID=119954 RepID=A0ACB9RB59_9MYRT|nr:hypothetical protein MLD38_013911 [Melastoma candidum]
METPSSLLAFSSQPYLIVSVFFTILGLASFFVFVASASSSKPKPSVSDGCCTGDTADSCSDPPPSDSSMAIGGTVAASTVERNAGASMMEQLVPEITTHALSYLDYTSLCRLSMTNSLMRKAANDDNAWKVLYHKDFTLEQGRVTPVNGWKAYYAATRAVVNVNSEFFDIIRERSLQAMSRLWFNADYVKCFHASGEFFSGYNAVIQSWQLAFNWDQGVDFLVRDVRVRVMTDIAWVTMKTFVGNMDAGPFNVTNVFEFHNGRWYMVHHHISVMLIDGEMGQLNVHG